MSNWKKNLESYAEVGRDSGDMNDDNMLARRILSGLGIKRDSKSVCQVEVAIFGHARPDSPMFERSVNILDYLHNVRYGNSLLMFASDAKTHEEIIDRLVVQAGSTDDDPDIDLVLVVREKVDRCMAYELVPIEDIHAVANPPFHVYPGMRHEDYGPMWLIAHELQHYVASLELMEGEARCIGYTS